MLFGLMSGKYLLIFVVVLALVIIGVLRSFKSED